MKILATTVLLLVSLTASAQNLIVLESTQQDIIDALESSSMIENVTLPCPEVASGMVSFDDFDFGGNAIILTTGSSADAVGPNDLNGTSTSNESEYTDAALEEIAGVGINDVCGLEFDITPTNNWLSFTYIFGSEEYPEFVCQFNDAMGIFVTGIYPGFGDYENENVIFIPGTNDPVTINNVNNSDCNTIDNSFYYSEDAIDMEYDGMTIPMMSTIPVVAGTTYHVRISIADALDSAFDSGLILGMTSFGASFELVSLETINKNDGNTATEGCEMVSVEASLPMAFDKDVIIDFEWLGTAEFGIDFIAPENQFIIPAGQTSASLTLEAFNDNEDEGEESAIMQLNKYTIGIQEFDLSNDLKLNILDFQESDLPTIAALPDAICPGDIIALEVSNASFVSWEPSTHLSADNVSNPTFSATDQGTYQYTVSMTFSDNCPPIEESLTITIDNCESSAIEIQTNTVDLINIFPNPFGRADFKITFENTASEIDVVEIFDARGKLMVKIVEAQESNMVPSSHWPAGMYYLNATFLDGTSVAKKLLK